MTISTIHAIKKAVAPAPVFGTIDAKINQWSLKILVKNGKVPANLSVEIGSLKLETIWNNLQNESATDIREHVRQLWLQAVELENEVREAMIDPTTPLETNSEIVEALTKYAASDKLNAQIMQYIVNGYALGCHHFASCLGVHTATIAARVHHIELFAKRGRTQSLKDRLIELFKIEIKNYGGVSATKSKQVE